MKATKWGCEGVLVVKVYELRLTEVVKVYWLLRYTGCEGVLIGVVKVYWL